MPPGRTELELDNFLPYVLNRLADRLSNELSTIYAEEYQLSIPEWRIIANLAEHHTLNARRIVEFTGMEKSKVSRAVKTLDGRGLVTQVQSSTDSRSKDLGLTEAGLALYQQLVPRVLSWESGLIDGLSSGEYRDLIHLLGRLDEGVQQLRTPEGDKVRDR
jgi:DNA-binding MarR family transcriptional regulator